MNYYQVIQKAIDFTEGNLFESISINDAARSVGFSTSHFYRVFSAVVGESFKSYMRKRRVSEGLILLKSSEFNIGRIAFETGFESHEVFIRSFNKVYGISPKRGRQLDGLILFEKFDALAMQSINENGVIHLKTNIILKDAFKIIGKSKSMNQADQVANNLIDSFMEAFLEGKKLIEPAAKSTKIISMYEYDPATLTEDDENINYVYTVGLELDKDCTVEGYEIKSIPQSKYAHFTLDRSARTLNGTPLDTLMYQGQPIDNIYDYIDGVWVLNSGYELSESPDFEVRDPDNESIIEYYISIK